MARSQQALALDYEEIGETKLIGVFEQRQLLGRSRRLGGALRRIVSKVVRKAPLRLSCCSPLRRRLMPPLRKQSTPSQCPMTCPAAS